MARLGVHERVRRAGRAPGPAGATRAARYAGPDRRSGPALTAPNPREFVLAGAILVVLAVPFAVVAGRGPLPRSLDATALNASLHAMTGVLAAVVGAVAVMRWRITGETVSLRIGLAVVCLGVVSAMQVASLVAPGLAEDDLPLTLGPGAQIWSLALLAVAFVVPEIDTAGDARRLAVLAVAGTAVAALLVDAWPALDRVVGASSATRAVTGGPTPLRLLVLAMFVTLAVGYTLRGLRQGRWLHTWIGLMLFALALSVAVQLLVEHPTDVRLAGSGALALCGLAFALNGCARELATAHASQRSQLFETELQVETVESRQRVERAEREEQVHDAQSALLSVQSTLRSLERHSETLDPGERHRISEALDAELSRLRDLLSGDAARGTPTAFLVADAIGPVVVCRGAAGADVRAIVDPDARAFGRPALVAEIVDNLIANALRHAPGSPITVRVAARPGGAEVRVEDQGPGIPVHDREGIFERGRRSGSEGLGLGLFVARRLAREQGGDLWVEEGEYGGAVFVLVVPGNGTPGRDADPEDDRGDGRGDGRRSSDLTMSGGAGCDTLVTNGLSAAWGGGVGAGTRDRSGRRGQRGGRR